MGNVPDEASVFAAVTPMVAAGVGIHWLRRREKAPVSKDWSTVPVATLADLRASYRSGYNVGIRLGEQSTTGAGYVYLLDIDIRKPELAPEAWAAVVAMWPAARSFPAVISGSRGESRHVYFVCDRPFRSHKLIVSPGFEMVFDPRRGRDVKKRDWEIELYGTGKQAVLPPSIHPDSGLPYRWERPVDWDMLSLGIGPVVAGDLVATWGVTEDDLTTGDEDDDLMAMVRSQPMGMSEDEIQRIIDGLPDFWVEDRDQWLQVGLALSHEFEGRARGFEIWCEWASQSQKYDARDSAIVWKSFKGRTANPVRMPTLIKAAAEHRLAVAHGDYDDEADDAPADDLADLLGPAQSRALTVISPRAADISDLLGSPKPRDDLAELLGPKPSIAPGAVGGFDADWKSYLQMTEDGTGIKATLHNVEMIVRNDVRTRGVIAFNDFTQEIVKRGRPGEFTLRKKGPKPIRQLSGEIWNLGDPINGDPWTDSHDNAIRAVLETPERQGGYSLKTSDRDLRGAVDAAAQQQRFHPVRNYLNGLAWDGISRVDSLFVDYLGATDNAYHREAATMLLLGAVTRVMEPGHKFDFVPILEGLQGKRKSTFIRVLGCSWSSELEGDFHDTQGMVERMQGSWILEIPELQGFSKAEVTTIKGFLSRVEDKVRMAYARRAVLFKRQCVFIGSTNDIEYLRDNTGGRRFWPIACTVDEIDTVRLEQNIDQIWAEAFAMYREMRAKHPRGNLPLYLRSEASSAEASRLQESRRQETVEDAMAGRIEHWLDTPIGSETGFDEVDPENVHYRNQVTLHDIWTQMMGRDLNDYDQRSQQMLGRAIRRVPGWDLSGQTRTKSGMQRVFRRRSADPMSFA